MLGDLASMTGPELESELLKSAERLRKQAPEPCKRLSWSVEEVEEAIMRTARETGTDPMLVLRKYLEPDLKVEIDAAWQACIDDGTLDPVIRKVTDQLVADEQPPYLDDGSAVLRGALGSALSRSECLEGTP